MRGATVTAGASPALLWPVSGPHGEPLRLSAQQRAVLALLHAMAGTHGGGRTTVARLAELTGSPSRGATDKQLQRLRSLGLVGYVATLGRHGCVRFWFGSSLRAAIRTRGQLRETARGRARDSGEMIPPSAIADSRAYESGRPPRPPATSTAYLGGRGPIFSGGRRRHVGRSPSGTPPLVTFARCPSGHRTKLGRWSWRREAAGLVASYRGLCRRCSVAFERIRRLELAEPELRGPSPAELADPGLVDRRRRMAAELVALLPAADAEQLARQYGLGRRPGGRHSTEPPASDGGGRPPPD